MLTTWLERYIEAALVNPADWDECLAIMLDKAPQVTEILVKAYPHWDPIVIRAAWEQGAEILMELLEEESDRDV